MNSDFASYALWEAYLKFRQPFPNTLGRLIRSHFSIHLHLTIANKPSFSYSYGPCK